MKLFKTIEDIQKYVRVNGTLSIESLEGFERDVFEKYIRRYLSQELLDLIITWYNATPVDNAPVNQPYVDLLPYIQNATIKFVMYMAAPTLDVQVTNSGFAVASTQNLAPASKDRVAAFRESMLAMSWDSIESMLKFLEKNKSDYTEWAESEACTIQTGLFINTAEEFNKHININDSVLRYLELRQTIEDVEILRIIPKISLEFADELKTQISAVSLTDANKKVVPYIVKSIANYTVFMAEMGDKYEAIAENYIMAAIRFMDLHRIDYPTYSDSIPLPTSYQQFDNNEKSPNYVFGG